MEHRDVRRGGAAFWRRDVTFLHTTPLVGIQPLRYVADLTVSNSPWQEDRADLASLLLHPHPPKLDQGDPPEEYMCGLLLPSSCRRLAPTDDEVKMVPKPEVDVLPWQFRLPVATRDAIADLIKEKVPKAPEVDESQFEALEVALSMFIWDMRNAALVIGSGQMRKLEQVEKAAARLKKAIGGPDDDTYELVTRWLGEKPSQYLLPKLGGLMKISGLRRALPAAIEREEGIEGKRRFARAGLQIALDEWWKMATGKPAHINDSSDRTPFMMFVKTVVETLPLEYEPGYSYARIKSHRGDYKAKAERDERIRAAWDAEHSKSEGAPKGPDRD